MGCRRFEAVGKVVRGRMEGRFDRRDEGTSLLPKLHWSCEQCRSAYVSEGVTKRFRWSARLPLLTANRRIKAHMVWVLHVITLASIWVLWGKPCCNHPD